MLFSRDVIVYSGKSLHKGNALKACASSSLILKRRGFETDLIERQNIRIAVRKEILSELRWREKLDTTERREIGNRSVKSSLTRAGSFMPRLENLR